VRPIAVTAAIGSRTLTLITLAEPVPDLCRYRSAGASRWADAATSAQLSLPPTSLSRHRDVADMPYRIITLACPSKLSSLLLTRNRSSLPSLTQHLLAAPDAAARQHGWHVSSTHHGFGRTNHDSHLGGLPLCAECWGRGLVSGPPSSPPRGLA
jgi:hypothetical protein